jgi:hypothetical protein
MKSLLLNVTSLFATTALFAQSAFLKRKMDDSYLIEKYEILNGSFSDTMHFGNQPVTQKDAVQFLETYSATHPNLSSREKNEIQHFIAKNGDWVSNGNGAIDSKKSILKYFYKKQSDMLNVQKSNYTFALNPIIAYQQMVESGNTKQNLFINTKGLEARGTIGKRLGFYTMFTDNQERGPQHFQHYVANNNAAPGMGYYKDFKETKPGNAVDYINATGYIDADVIKNMVNVSFGYDRFQIGDGYRSLFLSDFSAPFTFVKLNTRLWKFNYQNLYMELLPQFTRGGDKLLDKKYAAMHRLSINATKWLNIGLFESVVFGRKNRFDFGYMNPVILYRSIEQNNGSPDNAILGLDAKIHTGLKTMLYGQVVLDEFKFGEIKANNGWWANKWGVQMGLKSADIFGIKNLFVQAELNIVRPFTYSFRDSVADYTHYNQSLTHPYGANYAEASLQIKYKPTERLYVTMKGFYNKQGRDTVGGKSFGGNPLRDYGFKNANRGIKLFNGFASTVKFVNLNMAYEVRDNFYLDLGLNYRDEQGTRAPNPTFSSTQIYTGFRLNMARKQYDF